jgi:hypothetical protein
MEILPNNLPPPEATHLTTLITKLLLRWFVDVAIFLLIVLALLIWRNAHMDEDAKREELWRVLRGGVDLGSGSAAEEERRRWFVERLGGELGAAKVKGRGYGACEVEARIEGEEDEEWKEFRRAGREMAMIAEEMDRVRKGKGEISRGSWCDCDSTSSLLIPKL